MTLLNYVKGLWTALLPAATKAKMENIEDGIKAASDILDLETDAGRALTQAVNAEAQRSALGLGDSAIKDVGTGAGDVAAGNAPAGAVTTHESTYAHANLPTAAGKTAADAIGAASGATTALKLANLTSPASPAQQGVALLGASGGATKLTKMPDGATAVYSQDAWDTADGCTAANGVISFPSPGIIRVTWNGVGTYFGLSRVISLSAGHKILSKLSTNSNIGIIGFFHAAPSGNSWLDLGPCSSTPQIKLGQFPAIAGTNISILRSGSLVSGDYIDVDWLWIGDYSYLTGSASEEAARIANELGDTPGVGVAASGTLVIDGTASDTNSTVTIAGKVYTFVDVLTGAEGEILRDAVTVNFNVLNLSRAINRESPAVYNYGGSAPIYCVAAQHPLVSAYRSPVNTILLTARTVGLLGNQITMAASSGAGTDSHIDPSGSTLTGGKDAVGEKIRTQVENYIAGSGTRPAAAKTELTDNTKIGFEDEVDKAVGATLTFPAGGTWIWFVHGYGSNVGGLKKGSSAGGATITMAGANGSIWYRKFS